MNKASIIIPVIQPELGERCIKAIYQNAGIDKSQYEVVTAEDRERIGCPKMVKRLVAMTRFDCVMFLADDTFPYPDFLRYALEAMDTLPDKWGLVGLNDLHHDGNILATHWMGHKNLLPLLDGEFFHTGYYHCFSDQELLARCKGLGRYVWCKNAMIYHDHPDFTGKERNEDYKRVYCKENYGHDKNLFNERMKK